MKRYLQMRVKPLIPCVMGSLLLTTTLVAMADDVQVANAQALRGLAEYKHHQLMQRPDIKAELASIENQITALQTQSTQSANLSTSKSVVSSETLSLASSNQTQSVDQIVSQLKASQLMAKDPVFARHLLSRLSVLKRSMVADTTAGNKNLQANSITAAALADLSQDIRK